MSKPIPKVTWSYEISEPVIANKACSQIGAECCLG